MKDERIILLKKLIHLDDDLSIIKKELKNYPFDSEESLFVVKEIDLKNILESFINNNSLEFYLTLEEWANIVECRDDLDFENDKVHQIITELANPILYNKLTRLNLLKLLSRLDITLDGVDVNA